MIKTLKRLAAATSAMLAILVLALSPFAGAVANNVVYNAVPNVLPANVASLGYEATSTKEYGDYIHLAGTDRNLQKITVTMSDWALKTDYPTTGDVSTWTHPITVNVYKNTLTGGVPDTLITSRQQTITIPWRPAEDPTNCPLKDSPGYAFKWQSVPGPVNTNCSNGIAFNAVFDFSSLNVTLPDDVIIGVVYNTADYGPEPINAAGPYNSLNVGIPTNNVAAVGTDDNVDNVFWDTTYPGYTAGFKQDTGWAPNGTVALKVEVTNNQAGFPTNKDECKKDGWKSFFAPFTFKNQGDCVSFAETSAKKLKSNTQNLSLNSANVNGVDVPTVSGKWYKVTVAGTWTNRPNEVVDAECTNMQNGTWQNAVNGGYSPDLLDVQVEEAFVGWGTCDSTNHTYTKWVNATDSSMNLRVFDGDTTNNTQTPSWFGDNNGTMNVTVVSYN